MPLLVRETIREWRRCVISQNSNFQQVSLHVTSYSKGREGFVKQVSLLEEFLELLVGAHDR